jgi:hypothetical protein
MNYHAMLGRPNELKEKKIERERKRVSVRVLGSPIKRLWAVLLN